MYGCAMHSGRLPRPARVVGHRFACMLHGDNTSCPLSRPKVKARPRCTVSATATARCCWISVAQGSGAPAPGGGRHGVHTAHGAQRFAVNARMAGAVGDADGQVGLAGGQGFQGARQGFVAQADARGGASAKRLRTGSMTVALAMMVSTDRVNCDSQPVATRRTRLATASISASRRSPSRSSSPPVFGQRAWRGLRSNSKTSSASSIRRAVGQGTGAPCPFAAAPAKLPRAGTSCSMARASGVRTSRAVLHGEVSIELVLNDAIKQGGWKYAVRHPKFIQVQG